MYEIVREKFNAAMPGIIGMATLRGVSILDVAQGINVGLQIAIGVITFVIVFKKFKKLNQNDK